MPGYNVNGSFVSNVNVNSVMRNNDVVGIRQLFPDVNNNQLSGLTNLRRADNIPDSTLHAVKTRQTNVKLSHPETAVRNPAGVENALNRNPRLGEYLRGAGNVILIGAGVYLIINVADLVGSIVDSINRTGGSWYYRGNNGGDNLNNIERCVLRYRSCGMPFEAIENDICVLDPHDATNVDPLMSYSDAISFCDGFDQEREQTVCRGSNTNADPDSLQYLDISELAPNQTIECIEPYDFGDLIGDLNLDWLLGEDSAIASSSNSSTSLSDNFVTILLVIGGALILLFIGYITIKLLMQRRGDE